MRDSIYELLAADKEITVRRALAENPDISEVIQLILSNDSNDSVLTALSFNPNISSNLSKLPKISKLKTNGKDYSVKRKPSPTIKLNDKQKKELFLHKTVNSLILLALDSDSSDKDRADLLTLLDRKEIIDDSNIEMYSNAKVAFLINDAVKFEFISKFEKSKNQAVQEAMAANIKTPDTILKKLIKKKTEVRSYLANPNWYNPWPYFYTLVESYSSGGIDLIKKNEQTVIDGYRNQLKNSYKPAHIVSYKTLILENGGSI